MREGDRKRRRVKWFRIFVVLLSCFLLVSQASYAQLRRLNMSYIYFGSPTTYVEQVNKTKNSLDIVSPNYFDIDQNGELVITWKLQSSFINEMHRRGVKVVPFLSNHWSKTAGVNGLNNREQLVNSIVQAIQTYNLDGVNVDIEGIGHEYRDVHTDLVRLLRERLPKQKEVSVAVAANPRNFKTGWHGFYDYPELAKYADYLMIMSYDESWEGSSEGPVASSSFAERSIQYAINQGVAKEKIVMGIPFYGRIWKTDGPTLEGKSIMGTGISLNRVDPLVKQFNGQVRYDELSQSANATFRIPKGEHAFIANTKLTEGTYSLWFENEPSLKRKLRLVGEYDIRGTGSWSLAQEPADIWNYYRLWLDGQFFVDVAPGYWGAGDILLVSSKGLMVGTSSTHFSPTRPLTRDEGATILIRALGLQHAKPKEYKFKDIAANHWARDHVEVARELGIIQGMAPDRFAPKSKLTREQLAVILTRTFGYTAEPTGEDAFPDVSVNRQTYEAILAMKQRGIIGGLADGTFGPVKDSTRAEMAALINRLSSEFEKRRS